MPEGPALDIYGEPTAVVELTVTQLKWLRGKNSDTDSNNRNHKEGSLFGNG